MLCYICFTWTDRAIYPFKRLVYYLGAWMGYPSEIVGYFGEGAEWEVKAWLYSFATVLNLWLIAMPLMVGIMQNNIRRIDWKRKWIWGYIIVTFALCAWIGSYKPIAGTCISGMLLACLPIAYWSKYNRNDCSALTLMADNKAIVLYVAFISLLSLCIFIGKDVIVFIKGIALLVLPPTLYVLICKGVNYKPLTRHAVSLALCGILYLFIFHAPEWFKITTLSVSAALALYVAIDTYRLHRGKCIALALFIMPTLLIAPLSLGLNPYAVLDCDYVSKYHYGYYASEGVYIIEKDGKLGLRDRFGLILPTEYNEFKRLDKWGRYISVLEGPNTLIANNRYGIYDVGSRRFVLDPKSVAVSQIEQVNENTFNLIGPANGHFATLLLPGHHPEREDDYIPQIMIEPFHEQVKLETEEDPSYRALQEDLGECQQSDNAGAYELCDKARIAVNRQYKQIIDRDSTYRKVYDKWAILMEAMSGYLIDVTYGEPFYSMQPIQFNHDIRQWYEVFLPEVGVDNEIIFGDKIYTYSVKPRITSGDIDTFFYQFNPKNPGSYNRMWNEIKPAFFDWRFARAKYAEDLDPHKRLSYEEHTDYLTNYLFKEIKGLVETRNDNVIWDREHPDNK